MMRAAALSLCLALGIPAAEPLTIEGLHHVVFRVSDEIKARTFYGDLLGYSHAGPRFFVNREQYVQIEPGLPAGEDVRVRSVAFTVSDLDAAFRALRSRGIAADRKGGSLLVRDPEGNLLEFTALLRSSTTSPKGISIRMRHAGILVKKEYLERALDFYVSKLGLSEFWRGGPTDGDIRWINLRLPGTSGDYVELMLHDGAPTRGQLGSMHHICLEVDSVPAAYEELRRRGLSDEARHQPRVGRNGRRQLNLFDPDGTRTELMEPRPAEQ